MILVINFPFALHYYDQGTGIDLLGVNIFFAEKSLLLGID